MTYRYSKLLFDSKVDKDREIQSIHDAFESNDKLRPINSIATTSNILETEVYERVRKHGYEFRTIGVKLVRSDFSSTEPRATIAYRKVGIKISNLHRIERKKSV